MWSALDAIALIADRAIVSESRAPYGCRRCPSRPGDRIWQLKNDYTLEVFNGNLGTVQAVEPTEQELLNALDDGREIRYPLASLHQLTHAYAISVHKAQGAEFPAVVLPLLTSHAALLNERGYRTSGNRGRNLFTKDTVRPLLQNRFYLGELLDGNGGWRPGAHEPLLDDALFVAAQEARERRATNPLPVKRQARVHSLSGLLRCQYCGGKLHIHSEKGRARAYCYKGRQGPKCAQRSTFLDVYEAQILEYLETFALPEDLKDALQHVQERSREGVADVAAQRQRIETQLTNVRTMFELGDLSKDQYVERRTELIRQREGLHETNEWEAILAQAAGFLSNLPAAWRWYFVDSDQDES